MLCVIAKIDSNARERLMKLQEIPERFGIPPRNVYGHITLATYIGSEEDRFLSSCKAILSRYEKFSVTYEKIEVFASTSIIVAVPRKEYAIASIQQEISKRWAAGLNEWTQEDVWKPHTTLLYNPQINLHIIAKAMLEAFEPFTAQVEQIEFSHVCEDGYKKIDSFELQ